MTSEARSRWETSRSQMEQCWSCTKCLLCRLNRKVDICRRMSSGNECRLELGRRQEDALVQHCMKKTIETVHIRGFGRLEIEYITVGEEQREHRSSAIHPSRNVGLCSCSKQSALETGAERFEFVVWIFFLQASQCRKTSRNRKWITG